VLVLWLNTFELEAFIKTGLDAWCFLSGFVDRTVNTVNIVTLASRQLGNNQSRVIWNKREVSFGHKMTLYFLPSFLNFSISPQLLLPLPLPSLTALFIL